MYVNSGYLFNSRTPFKEKKIPLRILSAGVYQLHRWPKLPTWRPRGRVDWQLIYVSAGVGHFLLDGQDGKETLVPAGNMVLFQPKQEQHYYFLGADRAQYWFVHFTGRQVRNILRHYEIPLDRYILPTGLSHEYEDLFRRMRDELTECAWGYEEELTYLFRELLIAVNRRMKQGVPKAAGFALDEAERARDYFREHYPEKISVEQYAASRNMSASWFNKCFRATVGQSPLQYLLSVRMRNAQILLETTDAPVSEIAESVGYENSLYFSRLFRRTKGLSPMQYRQRYRSSGQDAGAQTSVRRKKNGV